MADLLDEVLDLEREAAQALAAEREKAARWLDQTLQEIERIAALDLERVKERAAAAEVSAAKAAGDNAASIVRESASLARRVAALDDERLRAVVSRFLTAVTP